MAREISGLLAFFILLAIAEVYAQRNVLTFTDTTGRIGEELIIPLRSSLSDSISGLAATVLFDPNIIRISNVSLTSFTRFFSLQATLSSGKLKIAIASARLKAGEGIIVNLTVRIIGSPGTASVLDIISAVLDEGEHTVTLNGGLITVRREARIRGFVHYYADLLPVPEVALRASNRVSGRSVSDTTDIHGGYVLGPMPLGDYQLMVEKEDSTYAAINVLDASDILQYTVGRIEFSRDQREVADVSGNGEVGTTDASLILRYLIGLETAFPVGPFWTFYPSRVIVSPLLEDEFQNFIAFLMGDVNGDWTFTTPAAKMVAIPTSSLKISEHLSLQPEQPAFILSGENFLDVRGGVLTVTYDPEMLHVDEVKAIDFPDDFLVAVNLQNAGEIRVAFAGANTIDGSVNLFHLNFITQKSQGTTTIEISSASLNGIQLPPQSLSRKVHLLGRSPYDFNMDGLVDFTDFFLFADHFGQGDPSYDLNADGVVDFDDFFIFADNFSKEDRAKLIALAHEFINLPVSASLESNYPNPFNSSTMIRYQVSRSGLVRLNVFDLMGQRIQLLINGYHSPGSYEVSWDGTNEQGSPVSTGMYLTKLEVGGFTEMKKMMLMK